MSVGVAESDTLDVNPQIIESDFSRLRTFKDRVHGAALRTAIAVSEYITSGEANVDEPSIAFELEESGGSANTGEEVSAEKRSLRSTVIRGIGIAVVGITGLLPAASKVYSGDFTTLPKAALSYVNVINDECEAAPKDIVEKTNDALDDPEDPRHSEWRERLFTSNLQIFYEEADVKLADLAAENNLTVVPRAEYEEKLVEATSPGQVVKIIQDYLANFGVEFNIADSMSVNEALINVEFIDINAVTEEDQAKTTVRLKEIAGYFFQEFHILPVELVDYMGIKEFKLGGEISKLGEPPVPALASFLNKRIYLDINNVRTYYISHELGHLLDLSFCGPNDLNNDPAFTSLATTNSHTGEQANMPWFEQRSATYFNPGELRELKADFYSQVLQSAAPRGQAPAINAEFNELFSRLAYVPEGKSVMRYYRSLWDKDVYDREKGTQVVPVYFDRTK